MIDCRRPVRLSLVLPFTYAACIAASAQAQTTWYVDNNNCPGPGTGSEANPFCTIQSGIDAAVDGDEVVVREGTYSGPLNRDLDFSHGLPKGQTRAITVRSTDPQDPSIVAVTIIDCQGANRGFHFHSGEGRDSIVSGLTITNGASFDVGGILCASSSPTIDRCVITGNRALLGNGGGIRCVDNSHPLISNCTISGNRAAFAGGGLYCFNGSTATIENCTISGNNGGYMGGGIACEGRSSVTAINTVISGNAALVGGGVFCSYGDSIAVSDFINCTVVGNSAGFERGGGGIDLVHGGIATLTNSILWANESGPAHIKPLVQ